jgi:hypothetical protein
MICFAFLVVLIIFLIVSLVGILETSYRMDKLTGTNQERWKRMFGK